MTSILKKMAGFLKNCRLIQYLELLTVVSLAQSLEFILIKILFLIKYKIYIFCVFIESNKLSTASLLAVLSDWWVWRH